MCKKTTRQEFEDRRNQTSRPSTTVITVLLTTTAEVAALEVSGGEQVVDSDDARKCDCATVTSANNRHI